MQFKNVCPICGKTCIDETELKIHMKNYHVLTIEQQIQMKKQKPKKQIKLKEQVQEISKLNIDINRHCFLSGQTQSGKSTVTKFIFANLPKNIKAIFYDLKNDNAHDKFASHFPIFTELDEIKKHFENSKSFFGKSKDMRIVYRPKRIKSEVVKTHSLENPSWQKVNQLCDYAFEMGNIIIFLDECAPICTTQSMPPAIFDCLVMGISRGVVIISTTQRPNIIHNSFISESYTRILFRQEIESDRIKLAGIIGKEQAEMLHKLPNQQFIISYIDGRYEKGKLVIPKKYRWIIP